MILKGPFQFSIFCENKRSNEGQGIQSTYPFTSTKSPTDTWDLGASGCAAAAAQALDTRTYPAARRIACLTQPVATDGTSWAQLQKPWGRPTSTWRAWFYCSAGMEKIHTFIASLALVAARCWHQVEPSARGVTALHSSGRGTPGMFRLLTGIHSVGAVSNEILLSPKLSQPVRT